jgi:hypothetical protein
MGGGQKFNPLGVRDRSSLSYTCTVVGKTHPNSLAGAIVLIGFTVAATNGHIDRRADLRKLHACSRQVGNKACSRLLLAKPSGIARLARNVPAHLASIQRLHGASSGYQQDSSEHQANNSTPHLLPRFPDKPSRRWFGSLDCSAPINLRVSVATLRLWIQAVAGSASNAMQMIGAHEVSRTPIFRPVTFVLLRRQEGYVREMAEPAGIDPAPFGREPKILTSRRRLRLGSRSRDRTALITA